MGLFDFFKKNSTSVQEDTNVNLELEDLRTGCFVDYDLESWKVQAAHKYDWDGDLSFEWQLVSSSKTLYLQMEEDDVKEWSLFEDISYGSLDSKIRNKLAETGDPPKTIGYNGVKYHLTTVSGGIFLQNGLDKKNAEPKEMLAWDFESDDGDRYLSIEQWAEHDFSASIGWPVEEYQFTNILPGAN